MRIVGGAWRGRRLIAPTGQETRPTADRVRQALFDMLMHAPWGGRAMIEGAAVLDVFAGTGALGLEALSRGATSACFVERDPAAVRALRANVVACGAEDRVRIVAGDVLGGGVGSAAVVPGGTRLPAPSWSGSSRPFAPGAPSGAGLVFLDPPYGQDLVPRAVALLVSAGWVDAKALVVAETGSDETWVPEAPVLAERRHGAARVLVYRLG